MRLSRNSLVTAVALLAALPGPAASEAPKIKADRYNPVLAQTPDGCQVWLIDDGWEGYAWTRTNKAGKPICMEVESCLTENSDRLFDTNSARLRPGEADRLKKFFRQEGVFSYGIHGHTDSRASDEYNMALSQRRANAVARVAQSVGARVAAANGYGERIPVASNDTAAGRQKNRRVEIVCYREVERY
ncbi:MAG: OmpA family protein [Rhodobacteraceae bacterium]|nr:OmpA family protein [Paracoccaceae bacterium]